MYTRVLCDVCYVSLFFFNLSQKNNFDFFFKKRKQQLNICEFVSRVPSILMAYCELNDKLQSFSDEKQQHLKKRKKKKRKGEEEILFDEKLEKHL